MVCVGAKSKEGGSYFLRRGAAALRFQRRGSNSKSCGREDDISLGRRKRWREEAERSEVKEIESGAIKIKSRPSFFSLRRVFPLFLLPLLLFLGGEGVFGFLEVSFPLFECEAP